MNLLKRRFILKLNSTVPNSSYLVFIISFGQLFIMSKWGILSVIVAPSVAPGSFKVKQGFSISQLDVSWSAISDAVANGILLGYKLKYTITQISGQPIVGSLTTKEFVLDKFTFFYKITGLQSYTTYSVSVSGYTGGGEGPFTTPISAGESMEIDVCTVNHNETLFESIKNPIRY